MKIIIPHYTSYTGVWKNKPIRNFYKNEPYKIQAKYFRRNNMSTTKENLLHIYANKNDDQHVHSRSLCLCSCCVLHEWHGCWGASMSIFTETKILFLPSGIFRVPRTGFLPTWHKYSLQITLQNIFSLFAISSGFRQIRMLHFTALCTYIQQRNLQNTCQINAPNLCTHTDTYI